MRQAYRRCGLLLALAFGWLGEGAGAAPAGGADLRDLLGAAHAGGTYDLTAEDFLNEGADQLLALGTRVIKVWLTPEIAQLYPFHSLWGPPPGSPVELARHPYFQVLFAKPFSTYLLIVEPVTGSPEFLAGMTGGQVAAESRQIYELARYLLATYAGTGKTFVLQNWEGDHLLRAGLAEGIDPEPARLRGMTQWWNARQDGVERARAEAGSAGERGVTVAHAAEVNQLRAAIRGAVTATNDVLPYTHADLYSYSSWDIDFDPAQLTRALDYLQSKAPPSALYGRRNILLGEYGMPRDLTPRGADRPSRLRELGDAALAWGVRYAVYWQIYCNELLHSVTARPVNADLRGFWLIRPDGVRTKMWRDLRQELSAARREATLRSASGQYLSAPVAQSGAIGAAAWSGGPWQTFALVGRGGAPLRGGDKLYLQTHGGLYLAVDPTQSWRLVAAGRLDQPPGPPPAGAGLGPEPSSGLTATSIATEPSLRAQNGELFVIHKLRGGGPIMSGDEIALEAATGRLLAVDFGGGGVFASGEPFAPGRPVAVAETFLIELDE
ncbi:MAG TPA: hypothetical protein VHR45_07965 [Thermoanaerobaculia bacterium]|nr:hypothetical protein [Thermoanaerobaculia bacterium]